MTPLQEIMNALDAALTGKSVERVLQDISPGPATVEEWIAQSGHNLNWYLSDDGLSRVVFSMTNRNLFLTHNSTERVRMHWESARPQIEAAERYLSRELDRIYGRSVGEAVVEALLESDDLIYDPKEFTMNPDLETDEVDPKEFISESSVYDVRRRREL